MRLDGEYYITKNIIPPLERIFNLVGANVRNWYEDMPKPHREQLHIREASRPTTSSTIHSYMKSRVCAVCTREETDEGMPLIQLY
jgi:DNA polymerase zeta